MRNVPHRILKFNKDRNPQMVVLKYAAMRENVFRFYRGTAHLFFEDLPKRISISDSTRVWVSGDLHLENFGTYKSSNRQIYFDINDFDEAALAPCTWELARVMTAIYVAGAGLGFKEKDCSTVSRIFLESFIRNLSIGKATMTERETAKGIVKNLFEKLQSRKRKEFLEERVVRSNGKFKLRIDGVKTMRLNAKKKNELIRFFRKKKITRDDKSFQVVDVAHRIVGTGSLGIERYVLLACEEKDSGKLHLFDLKEALPSSVKPPRHIEQPKWKDEASRITQIQHRMQSVSPASLSALRIGKKSFVLKALQPSNDRVNLESCRGKINKLADLATTLGEVTASSYLRSSGRQGSSIADELISFAAETSWKKGLMEFARQYSKQVAEDYQEYAVKFDEGFFGKKR